ncbi:MAG: pyridine nucleotide-disulfide oxidoreductase, partial [Desulfobacterales bacterium]
MQQDTTHMDPRESEMASQAYLQQLKNTFEQLPNEIPLYLFVAKGQDDVFTQANREVVRAFRQLTDKITMREYDLDHELAEKWNVTHSPTLVIAPEKYSIHWLGAPMGEEARTFLEILILIGLGKSQLSEQSLK